MQLLTVTQLKAALEQQFPLDTVFWCRATDEVRDMSREARLMVGLGEEHAVDFRALITPSQWNSKGVMSIVRLYDMMDDKVKQAFCDRFELWLSEWTEP